MTKVDSFADSALRQATEPGTECARVEGPTRLRAEVNTPGRRRHDVGPS